MDGATDCCDTDCSGTPGCIAETACGDTQDNDCDGFIDCEDLDCVTDPACASGDYDMDGSANAVDCAPTDGTAFAVPPEIRAPWLRVTKAGPAQYALSWPSQAAQAGTGTLYDVTSDDIGTWPVAAPPCLQDQNAGTAYTDTRAGTDNRYYLVRGDNTCPPSGEGPWGSDSLGGARSATCP
jgi:hypothetical protein